MDAWFKKDYSKLSKEEFKIVYAEYQDTSGLFLTEDFERVGFINHLNSRINYIKLFLKIQRSFIEEFNVPFLRDCELLKEKYGYGLKWNEDLEKFEAQLKKIEMREIKHEDFLTLKIKELNEFRKKSQKSDVSDDPEEELKKSRMGFIRMLNTLGKIGYRIDKPNTSVEELSLMIKQQLEENAG